MPDGKKEVMINMALTVITLIITSFTALEPHYMSKKEYFLSLFICLFFLSIGIGGYAFLNKKPAAAAATCTGSKYCKACKNCRYCKHCAKNGGACGVCR
ncbi:hypothetical protein [Chitinophaga sp. S165]|uniref:hypothetical protein n=1 Tax=Chitinophaga sp. S165 TaxID=2135462 RepID=UPI001E5D045A|nr:hypothetical protein [Chitinophaga sp. S165]